MKKALNRELLETVKKAFVPMAGGQAEPVAGASQMTAGMAAPMSDPSMGGGAPMDPSMGGGAPMDPSMAGGAPMDPSMMDPSMMDPSMMGMDPSAMGAPPGQISMSIPEFIELIGAIRGDSSNANPKTAKANNKADIASKLDAILQAVQQPGSQPPM